MNAPAITDDMREVLTIVRDGARPDQNHLPTVEALLACLRAELLEASGPARYRLTPAGVRTAGPRLMIVTALPANDAALEVPPALPPAAPGPPAPAARRRRADEGRARAARLGWEHRREAEELIVGNLPPELHALWAEVRGQFAVGDPEERTRAFVDWAEEHPGEAEAAAQRLADARLCALTDDAPFDVEPSALAIVLDREIARMTAERDELLERAAMTEE